VPPGAVRLLVWTLRAIFKMGQDEKLAEPAPDEKEGAKRAEAPPPPPMPSDAELLLARADAHARAGRLEVALYTYLAAALAALDRRGAIRLARDRTNGEYVRACKDGNARPPLRE